MINFTNSKVQKVELSNIDFFDKSFKISKNIIDETLLKSIKINGLLNCPILLKNKKNKNYQILFGSNRLLVMKDLGVDSIDVVLIDEILYDDYIKLILFKNYNNEIGPIGKLKVVKILGEFFNCDYKEVASVTKSSLNIPAKIIEPDSIEKIFGLSENLLNYIDYKDVNFKVILKLISLPVEVLSMLSYYMDSVNFKVNVFKKVLDVLSDLVKDENFIKKFTEIDWAEVDDGVSKEDFLIGKLHEMRYPEYSSDMKKVNKIIYSLRKNKIEVDFPQYFEDEKIVLKINIRKGDDIDNVINMIQDFDKEGIQRLLEFL